MTKFLLLLLNVIVLLNLSRGQIPIPPKPDGFTYKNGSFSAPIQIDYHVDLLCPDCKASFPTLLKVAEKYGKDIVRLNTHSFPLPYHRNAYLAATGSQAIVNGYDDMSFYTWAQGVFDNQDNFGNDFTQDMTVDDIISSFGKVAKDVNLNEKLVTKGLKDKNIDGQVRVSWKYSCTRGVAGTPTFFINGVFVNALSSWTVDQWSQVIDAILASSGVRIPKQTGQSQLLESGKRNNDCPASQETCEYLPGQIECCLSGESCIPNVGCRC